MESNVFDVVSLTSTCSRSPVPCPLSPVLFPPKESNPKGLYPMDSNVFDACRVSCLYLFPLSLFPRPWSPVPGPLSPRPPCPPLKNNPTVKVCIQWS